MSRVKTFEPATEQRKKRKRSDSGGGDGREDGDGVMGDDDLGIEKTSEYFKDPSVNVQGTDHRLQFFRISP